jgi:hypothetical protein
MRGALDPDSTAVKPRPDALGDGEDETGALTVSRVSLARIGQKQRGQIVFGRSIPEPVAATWKKTS